MPVNVLFVHSGDNWIRGSEGALLTALRGLDRSKVNPFLLCDQQILADEARKVGVEAFVYPIPLVMIDDEVKLQFFQWVATLRKVLQLRKQRNIDLFYSNGGRPCQVLYAASRIAHRPLICHVHIEYYLRYMLLYQLDRADRVIFVSRQNQEVMCSKTRFRGQHEVVYNGVDTDRFSPPPARLPQFRESWSIPHGAFVIGQVASLIKRKGTDLLARAFKIVLAKHPEARLMLVGEGPFRQELEALVKELQIERAVTFTGNMEDARAVFQHVLDVHVLASRGEGMPISLAEGAACGLPSIGAKRGGIPEVVLEGRNGLLFEGEDYQMLAEKICQLAENAELRRRFGQAGRELAVERFSGRRYADSIQRIILETAS